MDFSKAEVTNVITPEASTTSTVAVANLGTNLVEHSNSTKNNIITLRDSLRERIIQSGEAKQISDEMSIANMTTIIEFGKPVSEQMSSVADEVLKRSKNELLDEATNLMRSIGKIMEKVDIGEITDIDVNKNKGFLSRITNSAQKKLDQLRAKYDNIGNDIEKICVTLRVYEDQIKRANADIQKLYDNGVVTYQNLVKYTVAGEYALDEVNSYIQKVEQGEIVTDGELTLNNLMYAKQLLEQRVQDFRLAESVALQSLPMLKALEFGNLNLARKINSAFVITLPVFKNAIAQAMFIKQQQLQAKSLEALDKATNDMLLKNSQNVANNMRMTATLGGKSSIDMETLESSWRNIIDGINDTRSIQAELSKQREADKQKLEQLSQQYLSKVQM